MAIVLVVLLLVALVKTADIVAPSGNLTSAGCTVDYVYDGDTIAMDCAGEVQTARLLGFDTPEAKSPGCAIEAAHADRATQRLRALAGSGAVTLSGDTRDRYGRLLVVMKVDGQDVATPLIAEGLAVAYSGGARINWCNRLGAV